MGMRGHGGGPMQRLSMEKKKAARPIGVLLKALGAYLGKYKGLLIASGLISLLYAGTQILNPIFLSMGIDSIDPSNSNIITLFGFELTGLTAVLVYAGLFVFLGSLGFVINSFNTRILSRVRAFMVNDMRTDVYNKLINSSMSYIKKEQSGNITSRITSDTDEVSTGIQVFITIVVQLFLLVVTFFVILFQINWQILLICLGSIPFALLLSGILSTLGRKIVLRIRRKFGEVSGKMAESFSGVAVSKSFNQEVNLSNQMKVLNQQYYKMSIQFGIMMNVIMPIISTISAIVTSMILYVGGVITNLSYGEIFLGTMLAAQFLRPVTHLSMMFPTLQTSLGALDRILDIKEATPAIPDAPNAEQLNENYSIKFDKVWFAYDLDTWVLKDINFDVKQGEMVALVGHTGAGKTTLASMLLTRFYDIQKGSIKIGEQDIREVTQHSLRQAIGLIPQEPYLFTASVYDNIKYGKPDATDEEVYKICQMIGADTFIQALPDGYNTMVREGGKQLSAGQRQIITIARAMLSDPQILILDEATSRLDAYSESLVQDAQRKLFKDRTTFVIAHRLSTIHDADKIVVFEKGELMEMGTHDELMKSDGIYADLYETYYRFQGIDAIDIEAFLEEDEEEFDLSPQAMMTSGNIDPEKIKKMVAEGKLPPAALEHLKQMKESSSPEMKAKMVKKKKHPPH
ncbi:MAG: ABC transporter ATP-binding protein [Candidatus Heimdallarchaeota archaeon]|nr:ABC transporter ATP-binding protein [Candidatus Heimdallarchaeota archaeon]MBY8995669.1 ABC transporter ATP-binding protein [Candidatus Heimdallarchaeota archaeon]